MSASTNNPNSFCKRDVRSSRMVSITGDRTEGGSTADVFECLLSVLDGAVVILFDSDDTYEF